MADFSSLPVNVLKDKQSHKLDFITGEIDLPEVPETATPIFVLVGQLDVSEHMQYMNWTNNYLDSMTSIVCTSKHTLERCRSTISQET